MRIYPQPTNEYAFLQTALPNVICGTHGTDIWEPYTKLGEKIVFLCKRAGQINTSSKNKEKKYSDFMIKFKQMKLESEKIIKKYKVADKA